MKITVFCTIELENVKYMSVSTFSNAFSILWLVWLSECVHILCSVRSVEPGASPVISIHEVGNVGATKSERAGISKLKSDMKMVGDCSSRTKNIQARKYKSTIIRYKN